MAPVCEIPALEPAAVLLAITDRFPDELFVKVVPENPRLLIPIPAVVNEVACAVAAVPAFQSVRILVFEPVTKAVELVLAETVVAIT